jgi:phage terminase large subunit GpA-like protein
MGSDLDYNFNGSKNKFAHKLWMVGSSLLKTQTYANLRLPSAIDDGTYPSGYIHTPELESEYFKQLCSEALVKSKSGYEWVKQRERNEALDTYVYARCAAAMFGLDRFQDQDWQNLEGLTEDTSQPKPTVKPPSPPAPNLWRNQGLKPRGY